MTFYYLCIIVGKRNIPVDYLLTVNISDTEGERTFSHFIRFKIIITSAGYLDELAVLSEILKLCYRITVIPHLNSEPEIRGSLFILI